MTCTPFNIAKGKIAYYAGLPAANDALIAVLLKSSGVESAATLQDYTTLSAILAGTNDESTFTSYARQTCGSVTVTVDNVNNRVDVDCADISFTVGSSQALGMLVICYDNDTTGGTDANLVPLVMDDAVASTPATGTLIYQVATSGFFRAA
jgi:hypothetical protein